MSDKITKALAKFKPSEKIAVAQIFQALKQNNLADMDIKRLQGHPDVYRIRKGRIRIIYRTTPEGPIIIAVEYRNEKTYRNFRIF